jgi:hypothetical protein
MTNSATSNIKSVINNNALTISPKIQQPVIKQNKLHRGRRLPGKTAGGFGFVLIFSFVLSFVSRQKKEQVQIENRFKNLIRDIFK